MKKIIEVITNRYFLVTAFFFSWIFFFAKNDVLTQYKQNSEYKDMRAKINYLEQEIKNMQAQHQALLHDSAVIEKYAREHYRMKKAGEEIFVFDTVVAPKP